MPDMMRGAIQGGVGQGLEKAAGNIMNAFFMKKKLDVSQQVADAQKQKALSDTRRSDAYTNYLNNQDILKQLDAAHADVPAVIAAMQAKRSGVNGPGSTANQLATRYTGGAPPTTPQAIVSPQGADNVPAVRGMAMPQSNPVPDRSAMRPPAAQSPAMTPPPPPPSDPRNLLGPQKEFDLPMFGDHDAT